MDLRAAATFADYGAELGGAFETFWADYNALDPREQAELAGRAEHQLDELLDGPFS